MGVPKFFAFLSERYPCLSKSIENHEIPEIDNLYLDMNGIIHVCSHPDDANPHFRITEEDIFVAISTYIEFLFKTIKPRKLFFMAVDGVAPRAKMNQQRGRRFRTAKDTENQERMALERGETLPTEERFDSNCITPGTVFMDRLHKQLQYFVVRKISSDPLWQGCNVILSGHETPGEGEHKIMDYIRYLKSRPDWDPNTSHCLYGLDADLIMLGLCTHDPNFCLLREEVQFGKKRKTTTAASKTKFFLLHLSLLRDYLDLEFKELKNSLPFPYDIEHIVDDWIMMGFLVGNDFIPHLPNLHIHGGALPLLYKTYKEVLPTLDGYLNESGYLNLPRFQSFLTRMAELEFNTFEEENGDLLFMEQKTGRRLREWEEEEAPPKSAELQRLIAATEEEFETDEESEEGDRGTVRAEFAMHKNHYYRDKLELEDVNEEVLKSQAEGYVRAIQWILHYYYHGCQSWSWFYPHHYSPYVSDITNFKNMDLTFEKGQPFLPFHQLLAVLPPGSRSLLPECYQTLMTSEESPIIDFYPNEFDTDLNGKLQDYEALVLIPFIKEDRLLAAMNSCSDKLTPDERRRNSHGPMLSYKYTTSSLGPYKAPDYFPEVPSNHASLEPISREDIAVEPNVMLFRRHPDLDPSVYTPGFPSLRFLPHTGQLKNAKVQVFNMPSRRENMIIYVTVKEMSSAKEAAAKLVGKVVHVGWPHMVQATVVAVADPENRYYSTGRIDETTQTWQCHANAFKIDYMRRWGIDVGDVEVLLYVNRLKGMRYAVSESGTVNCEQVWNKEKEAFPLQTVVTQLKVQPPKRKLPKMMHELYPVGDKVILLEKLCYGASGIIQDNSAVNKDGTVKVELKIREEVNIDKQKLLDMDDNYMNCGHASRLVPCHGLVFAKLTGRLKGKGNNIGLDLKFNSRNQQVPGYTRKEGNTWLYSKKTVELVKKYLEAFPELEEFYQNKENDDTNDGENLDVIFGDGLGEQKSKEIKEWLKENAPKSPVLIATNTKMLAIKAIAKLDAALRTFKPNDTRSILKVKAKHLFKSDLVIGDVVPNSDSDFYLLDRVVACSSACSAPFGLPGYVIAIGNDEKGKPSTITVLFDDSFPEGSACFGCETPRVASMSPGAIINISSTQRDLKPLRYSDKLFSGKSHNNYANDNSPRKANNFSAFNNYSDYGSRNYFQNSPTSNQDWNSIGNNLNSGRPLKEGQNIGRMNTAAHTSAFASVPDSAATSNLLQSPSWRQPSSSSSNQFDSKNSRNRTTVATALRDSPFSTMPSPKAQGSIPSLFPEFAKTGGAKKMKLKEDKDIEPLVSPFSQMNLNQLKNQKEKEKTNFVILWSHFAASHLGFPKYTIQNAGESFTATINLPTGETFTSDPSPSKNEAIHSVCGVVLKKLGIEKSALTKKNDENLTPSVQNFFSLSSERKQEQKSVTEVRLPATASSKTDRDSKVIEDNPLLDALVKARSNTSPGGGLQQSKQNEPLEKPRVPQHLSRAAEKLTGQPLQQQLPLPPAQWQSPSKAKGGKKNIAASETFVNTKSTSTPQTNRQQEFSSNSKPAEKKNVDPIQQFLKQYPQYNTASQQQPWQQGSQHTMQQRPQQYSGKPPSVGPVGFDPVRQFLSQYPNYFANSPQQRSAQIRPPFAPYVPPPGRNISHFSPYSQQEVNSLSHGQPPGMGQHWKPPNSGPNFQQSRVFTSSNQAGMQQQVLAENSGKQQPVADSKDNRNPFVPLQAIIGTKVTRGVSVPQPKQAPKNEEPSVPAPAHSSVEDSNKRAKKPAPPRRRIAANLNFPSQ